MTNSYDLIVIGSGAAGIIAAITASKDGKSVLLVEKLPKLGSKLKATGGGKCNLTNTLDNETFMNSFGRDGRFMTKAINDFDHKDLIEFFKNIGVNTHNPDGFRVFPVTHNSSTILDALEKELNNLNVQILLSSSVDKILVENDKVSAIQIKDDIYYTNNIVLATGGLGYPSLGTTGDGFEMAKELGHKVTDLFPAMIPLHTKEDWVASCTADTIAKATIKVNIKKHSKLKACGDLIFTKKGIRGPVVLDFARELTPLIEKYVEVPILVNLVKDKNEDEIINFLKTKHQENPHSTILDILSQLLPNSVANELLKLSHIDQDTTYNKLQGQNKSNLIKYLASTPLTINGHDGFSKAMVTRGGINLKQIDPNTMKSKLIDGLYFAGEIVNLDGPCGGYNLQWSFSSGVLAGKLL